MRAACTVAILVGLVLAGQAGAQPASEVTTIAGASDPVGADVVAAGKQWFAHDPKGRSSLEDLARGGRADAQEMLGEALSRGYGGDPPDPVSACRYFQQASSVRTDALHSLAHCAEQGVGGPPDFAKAAQLYGQAADKGYPKSMCALGNLYIGGRGVPMDAQRGAALCRRGAEAGDRDAQTDLANLYLSGKVLPHDMFQARAWYEKAAAQGQANAEFVLGEIYWNGDGVKADRARAAELWRSAYGHGRTDAAPLLATWALSNWMAAHPRGNVTLLDEAIRWDEAALKTAHDEKSRQAAASALTMALAIRGSAAKR